MGLDRVLSRLESNENTFISLSNQYGQDALSLQEKERKANLDSIKDFSQTLSEHLVREKKEENKRLEDEGRIIQIEEEMRRQEEEGNPGISSEEKINYYTGVEVLQNNKLAFDSAALATQEKGGPSRKRSWQVITIKRGWKERWQITLIYRLVMEEETSLHLKQKVCQKSL
jgi:hypothetical protein